MPGSESPLPGIFARNKAVFDWCLRSARRCLEQGEQAAACQWASHAAWLASSRGWFGTLSSQDLESLMVELARALRPAEPRTPRANGGHWLHIVTTAYEIGGHTNMLCRWIRADPSVIHDVLLTEQAAQAPSKLTSAVSASGGRIIILDQALTCLDKSQHIREIAAHEADVVVLHHHPHDVAPLIAFGCAGGPPVLLVNHADHLFWPGSSVADLILEFRHIGQRWTREFRGSTRSVILPLPLDPPRAPFQADATRQREARRRLSLPEEGVMLLAVASEYKFEASGSWSFHRAARDILNACPQAWLVAVGPSARGAWLDLMGSFQGRVILPGSIDVSSPENDVLAAADIGLGAFPFASQTSLLEAGLQGLACVPTPLQIPYGFDDVSFLGVDWPETQEDYVQLAIELVRDRDRRLSTGAALQAKIIRDHSGRGWMSYLDSVKAAIPSHHQPEAPAAERALPESIAAFWARFTRLHQEHPLTHLHGRLIARLPRLQPHHDSALVNDLGPQDPYARLAGLRYLAGRLRFDAGRLRHRWFGRNLAKS